MNWDKGGLFLLFLLRYYTRVQSTHALWADAGVKRIAKALKNVQAFAFTWIIHHAN